jgi:predicted GIY-YIG superfamily endonuclease
MSQVTPGFNYVYILQAKSEPLRLNLGITPNLAHGLAQHNAGEIPATAQYRPWVIKLALAFRDSACAERFERYLKTSSGREFAKRHF